VTEDVPVTLIDDDLCFACGHRNPIGLHLAFEWDGDVYRSHWTPQREHQGWADRVHGGLLAVVLDEVLSRAALERHGLHWVTAELTSRLRRPARIGVPLIIEATLTTVRRALIVSRGEIREAETGLCVATGEAKLMRVKQP
jgi:acyl-coenzyme A thioesterase PaaI-like protein